MRGTNQQTRGTEGRRSAEEIQAGPSTPVQQVKIILWEQRAKLARLFPKDGEAAVERAIVMAMAEHMRLDPRGDSKVDPYSTAEAAVMCMKLDIEPGDDCYFVPFKGRVKLITSPRGLIKLGMRSGFVKSASARGVVLGDEFKYTLGDEDRIEHHPGPNFPADPKVMWDMLEYAYAVVHTTTGGKVVEVLNRARIEYYRSKSPSATSADSLWAKFPWEAARKSALKQAFNSVPRSSQMSIALREDEAEGVQVTDEILELLRSNLREVAPPPIASDVGTINGTIPMSDTNGAAS